MIVFQFQYKFANDSNAWVYKDSISIFKISID